MKGERRGQYSIWINEQYSIWINEQYSIRINDQWRICFRWMEGDGAEVEIVDYH